jgi:Zn-dependent protease
LPLWYAVFLLSLTCHEAAHAFVALRAGDPTAYLGGQVTLNPVPHMRREPVGTLLIPLVTFWLAKGGWMMGWASAPYDPLWADRHPRRAAAMAAAGPLANLILASIGFALLRAGILAGLWTIPTSDSIAIDALVAPVGDAGASFDWLGRFASILLALNLLLCLFNLVPLPPLDGGSIAAGLWEPARRFLRGIAETGMGSLIGLVVAWYAVGYVFHPAFGLILLWLYR